MAQLNQRLDVGANEECLNPGPVQMPSDARVPLSRERYMQVDLPVCDVSAFCEFHGLVILCQDIRSCVGRGHIGYRRFVDRPDEGYDGGIFDLSCE